MMGLNFALVLLTIFSYAFNANAQEFGRANESVPELSQFEYLRGEWHVVIDVRQTDSSFKRSENTAKVKGFYHVDGRSFQAIFSTATGAFTTDIRTYNIEEEKWQILFMNARAQRWHSFEARLINGVMETYVVGGYSGKEDFDVKILDKNITNDHFTKEVYRKQKDSEVWRKMYIMNYRRLN